MNRVPYAIDDEKLAYLKAKYGQNRQFSEGTRFVGWEFRSMYGRENENTSLFLSTLTPFRSHTKQI